MKVDAQGSREVQAAIFAMKLADRDLRKDLYARARGALAPAWERGLSAAASTPIERRVIVSTSRVRASSQSFTVTAATQSRPLSGGLVPNRDAHAVEYGAGKGEQETTARSRRGKTYTYTRARNAMLRGRNRRGYVAQPVAKAIGRRLVALWVQTIVRTYRDAAEKGQ